MITQLTQENITEYASEAQTIQEPTGTDYTQGVRVGKTIPAKWWNWLFKGATRRLGQSRADAQSMLTELQNAVTDAGIALDASDSHQLSKAVLADAYAQVDKYVEDKKAFMRTWYQYELPYADSYIAIMQQVGSLCVAYIRSETTQGVIAASFDAQDWHPIVGASGSCHVLQCAYYHGVYYVMVACDGLESSKNIVVFSSANGINWSIVFSATDYYSYTSVFFDVLDDDLYFIYFNFNASGSYVKKLNTVSGLFENTSMFYEKINGTGISTIYNRYGCKALQLRNGKYLIGNSIIDTANETITTVGVAVYNYYCNLGATEPDVQSVDSRRTTVLKLINGNIALIQFSQSQPQGYTGVITVLDADGALVRTNGFSFNEGTTFASINTIPLQPTYIITRIQGSYAFSLDAISYSMIPFDASTVRLTQIGSTFFIAVYDSGTSKHLIYKIDGRLSTELSDYTLIAELNFGIINFNFSYKGIGEVLAIEGDNIAKVSLDGGITWVDSKIVGGSVIAPFVYASLKNKAVSFYNKYVTVTQTLVNTVAGFTLYLR